MNGARSMELHAIHQYMTQHYDLDNMDYGDMAMKMKLIAIDEMRHAEILADRIEELGGQPTSELSDVVRKGQTVEEVFPFDIKLEDDAIDYYNQYIQVPGTMATTRPSTSFRRSSTKSRCITLISTT